MRVLGIDPGYERMGVAVIERTSGKEDLLFSDCVRTSSSDSMPERLRTLGQTLENILATWKPDRCGVEKLYFEKNQKTGIAVAAVTGIITYVVTLHNIPIYEYTPLQIKAAVTGYGKASKNDIMRMLPKLLHIEKQKMLDDEYDAIAVALTCLVSNRQS